MSRALLLSLVAVPAAAQTLPIAPIVVQQSAAAPILWASAPAVPSAAWGPQGPWWTVEAGLLYSTPTAPPDRPIAHQENLTTGARTAALRTRDVGGHAALAPDVTLGWHLDDQRVWELRGFWFDEFTRTRQLRLVPDGNTVNRNEVSPIGVVLATGSAEATTDARTTMRLSSVQFGKRRVFRDDETRTASIYAGARYTYFREGLETSNYNLLGEGFEVFGFGADNHMVGGELSADFAEHFGPLTLGLRGGCMLGANNAEVRGAWNSRPGEGSLPPGARFVLTQRGSAVSTVSNLGLYAGMQVTQRMVIRIGYDLTMLSGVAFGSSQIARGLVGTTPAADEAGFAIVPGRLDPVKTNGFLALNGLSASVRLGW